MRTKKASAKLASNVRKVRSTQLKFKANRKEAIKALVSLLSGLKAAESKWQSKAKEVSAIVEKMHLSAEDKVPYFYNPEGTSSGANPRIQEEITFQDSIDAVENYLEAVKELER